jgi:hypothetical protein
MYLQVTECEVVDWIQLAHCKIQLQISVNMVMNFGFVTGGDVTS